MELGKRIFGSYDNKTIMLIGAGKMSELSAKHLYSNGAHKVIVVNRTLERAQELADKFNGIACPMDRMFDYLPDVDVIISSTGAKELVLTHGMIQHVIQKRKSRPLFMIDIAVPRDIDPAISELPGVFLYDIDDLQLIVDHNLEERRKEAVKIEEMITLELAAFEQWKKTLAVSPVIQALQTKANAIHENTLDNLLNRLPELSDHERKLIRKLTKSMMNQMLRDPILKIKEMSVERKGDEALELFFTQVFALEDQLAEQERKEEARKAQRTAEKEIDAGWNTDKPAGGRLNPVPEILI